MSHNEGLDIQELYKTLWKGKKIIVIFFIVFSFIGGAYSFYSQNLWISSAIVYKSNDKNFINLKMQLSNLYLVLDNDNGKSNKIIDTDEIFNVFIKEFSSNKNKIKFILSNDILSKYKNKFSNDDAFVNYWVSKIKEQQSGNPKKAILYFQTENKKDSVALLNEYIKFINSIVTKKIINNVEDILKEHKATIDTNIKYLTKIAKEKINIALKKTQIELKIALAAGVKSPILLNDNNRLFSIQLGSKGLIEQENILRTMKDFNLFEPQLGIEKEKLKLLEDIDVNNINFNVNTVKVLIKSAPVNSKSISKRLFMSLVSAFIGILIGMLYVLVKNLYIRVSNEN